MHIVTGSLLSFQKILIRVCSIPAYKPRYYPVLVRYGTVTLFPTESNDTLVMDSGHPAYLSGLTGEDTELGPGLHCYHLSRGHYSFSKRHLLGVCSIPAYKPRYHLVPVRCGTVTFSPPNPTMPLSWSRVTPPTSLGLQVRTPNLDRV